MIAALPSIRTDRPSLTPTALILVLAVLASDVVRPASARAQTAAWGQAPAAAVPAAPLPEPVYWKQNVFLIPYQWSSSADPAGAQAVWLLVSKDGGASWQKISEAKPQVRAFTYRAEQDGEYWFAIRTIDHAGRPWPAGPYQPELRVVVDTTRPRIEALSGATHEDGTLEITWRAVDRNIDPGSWQIEVQTASSNEWQSVPLPAVGNVATDVSTGHTTWTPADGGRPTVLQAVVYDRAGNPANYNTNVPLARVRSEDAQGGLSVNDGRGVLPRTGNIGWVSVSSAAANDGPRGAAPTQPWPADTVERAPFRLYGSAADLAANEGTSYGRPPGVGTPLAVSAGDHAADVAPHASPLARGEGTGDRYATTAPAGPTFAPLEPFREASLSRLPAVAGAPVRGDMVGSASLRPEHDSGQLPPGVTPKEVSSRTFALEYALEEVGRWGVSKVELWGTRDHGQTWQCYATDDDNRSPIQVTVDGEGLYGFRIVVYSAAGTGTFPPRAGERPELWVAVDLHRPTVELTSIEPGSGNQADYLVLRWQAEDDNLEERPISLFYSSRPAGPWSTMATGLENTGEYAWRLERHVPARFYLRLEARDTAGNLAAYQTAEPVLLERPRPTGRIEGVHPVSSAAKSTATTER